MPGILFSSSRRGRKAARRFPGKSRFPLTLHMSVPSRTGFFWALGGEADSPLAIDLVRVLGVKSVADFDLFRDRRGVWGVVLSITDGLEGMGISWISSMEISACVGLGSGSEGVGISMVNAIGISGRDCPKLRTWVLPLKVQERVGVVSWGWLFVLR